jgi:4a-hydroxytetrahydrobiopterin dehydratase
MTEDIAQSLKRSRCVPCEGGIAALDDAQIAPLLAGLPGWSRTGNTIERTWRFANYHESVAFVNATAWISHREDHHPDIVLGWGTVTVRYTTHAIDGLSTNDFICAAKIDALFDL